MRTHGTDCTTLVTKFPIQLEGENFELEDIKEGSQFNVKFYWEKPEKASYSEPEHYGEFFITKVMYMGEDIFNKIQFPDLYNLENQILEEIL